MKPSRNHYNATRKLIREAKSQRACELRQAAQHVHEMARQRGLSMLIVAGLALLGGYALHEAHGRTQIPAATQGRWTFNTASATR